MSKILTPDICVIGAGSGGLTVAAAASSFGVDVVLIEKGKMGGDCLNYGCVPSKALISAAKHAHAMQDGADFGITSGAADIDYKKVHDHVHDVIAQIAPHDSVERFESLGVKVIQAAGRFTDRDTVSAGDYEIKARRFVIATGSAPAILPIDGLSDVPFFTNETIFANEEKLDHLIIIGGGPIGMELAQAHVRLGAKVTLIEAFKVLGRDDPEMAKIVIDQIRDDGVEIIEGAPVSSLEKNESGIVVHMKGDQGEQTVTGSHLLVAAGRSVNVDGLGLEAAGVSFTGKGIETDKGLRTTNRRVYAVGDVAGGPQFTHWAGYQAGLVLRSILFRLPISENRDLLPWVTYTTPELAHCGLTEEDARKRHGTVKSLTWSFAENDRAQADRQTKGMIKVVLAKNGRILGADIVGHNAGELISMWSLAISQKMKIRAMTGFVAPYPTYSEISRRVAVSNYSDSTKNPLVRAVIRFLRRFG
ncbi:MAG: FAD-dependent oxidoreductase [Stappiaceae bacterium]